MTPADVPLEMWLLFAAPLAALAIGFFVMRPWRPEWTHLPILASCAVVTASAWALAARVVVGRSFDVNLFPWATAGQWGVHAGLRLDGPGAAVLAMVALVGSLIHVYAAGYMKGDPGFSRFFLVFHLFFLAMIGLLTANNFVQLYLFWELVGVASYLLVGYWYQKESARRAALKAFLTNRVGDFGFLIALLLILAVYKTAHFHLLYALVANGHRELLGLIGALLIWAACAKSAQFPLYFWLPDAMEGPTPTSALMHAATMVTAGVFLLVRAWPLIAVVDGLPELVAWIGGITAFGAAVVAGTKKDLKRILAYSTVSHLGLMMLALGLGRVGVALFHLVVHGFFKACLFLCAGNIAHALHQPTANVDQVGGFRRAMPLTYASFWAAALSLSGIWPFGGFYSKDAVLEAARHHGGALGVLALLVSAGSAFYIFRMLLLTFHGERPEQKGLASHPHEAEPILAVPVAFLALGAAVVGLAGPLLERMVVSGWLGLPIGIPGISAVLNLPGSPTLPVLHVSDAFGLGGLLAAAGFGAAWFVTMTDPGFDWRWRRDRPWLERVFESDFGWKPLVDGGVRAVASVAGFTGRVLDKRWWDGAIEGSAGAARRAADALAAWSQGRLNDYLWWMAAGAALLLGKALR